MPCVAAVPGLRGMDLQVGPLLAAGSCGHRLPGAAYSSGLDDMVEKRAAAGRLCAAVAVAAGAGGAEQAAPGREQSGPSGETREDELRFMERLDRIDLYYLLMEVGPDWSFKDLQRVEKKLADAGIMKINELAEVLESDGLNEKMRQLGYPVFSKCHTDRFHDFIQCRRSGRISLREIDNRIDGISRDMDSRIKKEIQAEMRRIGAELRADIGREIESVVNDMKSFKHQIDREMQAIEDSFRLMEREVDTMREKLGCLEEQCLAHPQRSTEPEGCNSAVEVEWSDSMPCSDAKATGTRPSQDESSVVVYKQIVDDLEPGDLKLGSNWGACEQALPGHDVNDWYAKSKDFPSAECSLSSHALSAESSIGLQIPAHHGFPPSMPAESLTKAQESAPSRGTLLPANRFCFFRGTWVLTKGGSKHISDLQPGDELEGIGGTPPVRVKRIRRMENKTRKVVTFSYCESRSRAVQPWLFRLASNHPLLVQHPLAKRHQLSIPVGDLQCRDRLCSFGGRCEVEMFDEKLDDETCWQLELEAKAEAVYAAMGDVDLPVQPAREAFIKVSGELPPRPFRDFVKILSFFSFGEVQEDYLQMLRESDDLSRCRRVLKEAGFLEAWETHGLGPGDMFVEKNMASKVIEALRARGKPLTRREVVVSSQFEKLVVDIILSRLSGCTGSIQKDTCPEFRSRKMWGEDSSMSLKINEFRFLVTRTFVDLRKKPLQERVDVHTCRR